MAFILASILATHSRDEMGNRVSQVINNENDIVTNIKKYVKSLNRLVVIANDPNDFDNNDLKVQIVYESSNKTDLAFKEKIVLDNRNYNKAKEIVCGADLILLSGGKCLCQSLFFNKIKLKKLLKNFDGLIIGSSAGAMNLCETVANFPEEIADLKEKRWLKGLGFCKEIIIPHFDGENLKYQIECDEVDLINDYVLPMSNNKSFIGIPNGSYILIDNEGKLHYFGTMYKIENGNVIKIQ